MASVDLRKDRRVCCRIADSRSCPSQAINRASPVYPPDAKAQTLHTFVQRSRLPGDVDDSIPISKVRNPATNPRRARCIAGQHIMAVVTLYADHPGCA